MLLNEYYVIPHWHNTVHGVSYDSRLARPKTYLFITDRRFGHFQHGGGGELKDEFDVTNVCFLNGSSMIPTLLGILAITSVIIQFVPGGPVEQMVRMLEGDHSSFGGVNTGVATPGSTTGTDRSELG